MENIVGTCEECNNNLTNCDCDAKQWTEKRVQFLKDNPTFGKLTALQKAKVALRKHLEELSDYEKNLLRLELVENTKEDIKRYLITATICRKRCYFCIEALTSKEAIKIFNDMYPDQKFRNFKELIEIKRYVF